MVLFQAPNQVEIIIRPSLLLIRRDDIHQEDQMLVVGAGQHAISLLGGKSHTSVTTPYQEIYEQNKDALWTLLEGYKCTGNKDWMTRVDSPRLRLDLLIELIEEGGLIPSERILGSIAETLSSTQEYDKYSQIVKSEQEATNNPKPTIVDLRPFILYVEKETGKDTLLFLPIYKGNVSGKSKYIISNIMFHSRQDGNEVTVAKWVGVNQLYRNGDKGSLTRTYLTMETKEREVHFSVSYIARGIDTPRERIELPHASDLEGQLK